MLTVNGKEERIVAILRDVIEKAGWKLDNLRSQDSLQPSTLCPSSWDSAFVKRTGQNDQWRGVRIADLKDNIVSVQSRSEDSKARENWKKYHQGLAELAKNSTVRNTLFVLEKERNEPLGPSTLKSR